MGGGIRGMQTRDLTQGQQRERERRNEPMRIDYCWFEQ